MVEPGGTLYGIPCYIVCIRNDVVLQDAKTWAMSCVPRQRGWHFHFDGTFAFIDKSYAAAFKLMFG